MFLTVIPATAERSPSPKCLKTLTSASGRESVRGSEQTVQDCALVMFYSDVNSIRRSKLFNFCVLIMCIVPTVVSIALFVYCLSYLSVCKVTSIEKEYMVSLAMQALWNDVCVLTC